MYTTREVGAGSPGFELAREFLLAAMDEGMPIQAAPGKVIRVMSVKALGVTRRRVSELRGGRLDRFSSIALARMLD